MQTRPGRGEASKYQTAVSFIHLTFASNAVWQLVIPFSWLTPVRFLVAWACHLFAALLHERLGSPSSILYANAGGNSTLRLLCDSFIRYNIPFPHPMAWEACFAGSTQPVQMTCWTVPETRSSADVPKPMLFLRRHHTSNLLGHHTSSESETRITAFLQTRPMRQRGSSLVLPGQSL